MTQLRSNLDGRDLDWDLTIALAFEVEAGVLETGAGQMDSYGWQAGLRLLDRSTDSPQIDHHSYGSRLDIQLGVWTKASWHRHPGGCVRRVPADGVRNELLGAFTGLDVTLIPARLDSKGIRTDGLSTSTTPVTILLAAT